MSDRLKPLIARAIEGPLTRAQAEAAFAAIMEGEATPAQSTQRRPMAGLRRSVAAVTMPSVPSEPISNCLRSKPRLSFFSGVSASNRAPSASTASSPRTWARMVP